MEGMTVSGHTPVGSPPRPAAISHADLGCTGSKFARSKSCSSLPFLLALALYHFPLFFSTKQQAITGTFLLNKCSLPRIAFFYRMW